MTEGVTLTDERLEEIRENDFLSIFPHVTTAARDRRDLLAEVDRLRAQVGRVEALLDASDEGVLYKRRYLSLAARASVRATLEDSE